jgi:two-component system, OmpR family, phosphate regulon response regulator PhoB
LPEFLVFSICAKKGGAVSGVDQGVVSEADTGLSGLDLFDGDNGRLGSGDRSNTVAKSIEGLHATGDPARFSRRRPTALIVEDDMALSELLQWHFGNDGFEVRATGDGEVALMLVDEQLPDIIILDWLIEQLPGLEVCRRLRLAPKSAAVPIIMLTARSNEDDRILGLKTGADDYMTKPFSPRELLARVEALLRRSRPALSGETLRLGDVELDCASHRAYRRGIEVHLGPTEFRLLLHFMERPGRVLSRQQLIDSVWGMERDVDERTVDVYILRLRRAMAVSGFPDIIKTVRSAGYSMNPN